MNLSPAIELLFMIIVDTNMLMEAKKIFRNLKEFSDYGEVVVLSNSIRELQRLNKREARLALELIKHNRIKILDAGENDADVAILRIASRGDAVATNDKKLIKQLKIKGIKTIRLRQGKYMVVA